MVLTLNTLCEPAKRFPNTFHISYQTTTSGLIKRMRDKTSLIPSMTALSRILSVLKKLKECSKKYQRFDEMSA